jgi:hypothetical protein
MERFLSRLSKENLRTLADQKSLEAQPDIRFVVLTVLRDQLIALGEPEQEALAGVYQDIAALQMKPNFYRPRDAAANYAKALELKRNQPQPLAATIETLMQGQMDALLQSKQYLEAIEFARQNINADAKNQGVMGRSIKIEVDRLQQEAARLQQSAELEDALKLINQALAMVPELAPEYRTQLESSRGEIERSLQSFPSRQPGAPSTRPAATTNSTG